MRPLKLYHQQKRLIKMNKINTIIKKSLLRKKQENPLLSLRFLAKQMGVKHSFLSEILSGKKKWPLKLLDEVIDILDMDDLNKNILSELLFDEIFKELAKKSKLLKMIRKNRNSLSEGKREIHETFKEEPSTTTSLIGRWYFIALLDLVTCEDFQFNFSWISKRLGISLYEAEYAWNFLLTKNYISNINGRWKKTDQHLRIPTTSSQPQVRTYHRAILAKAMDTLNSDKTSQNDFNGRLIINLSVAANLEKLQEVKTYIHKMAYNAAGLLNHKPCNEVYQICIALFPISKENQN